MKTHIIGDEKGVNSHTEEIIKADWRSDEMLLSLQQFQGRNDTSSF